jgi:hypothetical protein
MLEEVPTYKIYAKWHEGTDVPIATIRDSVGYSPEKLLLFSQIASLRTNEQYFSTNKQYDITMGYDGPADGTLLTPRTIGGTDYIDIFDSESSPRATV